LLLAICFTGDEALVQCPVLDWEDTCVCRNSRSYDDPSVWTWLYTLFLQFEK